MRLTEALNSNRVVLWGVGAEANSAAHYLLANGYKKQIIAFNPKSDDIHHGLMEFVNEGAIDLIDPLPVDFNQFQGCTVFKSPGLTRYSSEFQSLSEIASSITNVTDMFLSNRNGTRVIGVTGSKGKNTTSSLLRHLIAGVGIEVALGGNIGTPLFDIDTTDEQWVIAEISSFQAAEVSCSPQIGIVTSLFEEHTDWHQTHDLYITDKLRLFSHSQCEHVVTTFECAATVSRFSKATTHHVPFNGFRSELDGIYYDDQLICASTDFRARGSHMLQNAVIALSTLEFVIGENVVDESIPTLSKLLKTFEPLPHRMAEVGNIGQAKVFDDGIATNPSSALEALKQFSQETLAIFIGGYDRGADYTALISQLSDRSLPTLVIVFGPVGKRIINSLEVATESSPQCIVEFANTLGESIEMVASQLSNYHNVVFSPAAPSFDEFKNYVERSEYFINQMHIRGLLLS